MRSGPTSPTSWPPPRPNSGLDNGSPGGERDYRSRGSRCEARRVFKSTALTRLRTFRQQLHASLGLRQDSLFELLDSALSSPDRRTLVHLSLNWAFRRRWPSTCDALADITLDPSALPRLFQQSLPEDVWSVREGADGKGPALAARQPPASRGAGLHPAPPGAAHHRRRAPALGDSPTSRPSCAHPRLCPSGSSAAPGHTRHTSKRAKTLRSLTGTPERRPVRPSTALPGAQKAA